jgi:hypothetical protein
MSEKSDKLGSSGYFMDNSDFALKPTANRKVNLFYARDKLIIFSKMMNLPVIRTSQR